MSPHGSRRAVQWKDRRRRQMCISNRIYTLIGELAAAGKAVIVASSHLPELLGLCDTIGVMCRGSLVAVRPRAEWSEAELLRVATGAAAPSP